MTSSDTTAETEGQPLSAIPGRIAGAVMTGLECVLFHFSLRWRVAVIRLYRHGTGNVIR